METFSVASWNMKSSRARSEAAWAYLREQDVDAAAVQEAVIPDSLATVHTQRTARPPKGPFNTGVVSLKPRIAALDNGAAIAGGRAVGVIFPDQDNFLLFSIHSFKDGYEGTYPRAADAIVYEILTLADGYKDHPIVVAGDFNASLEFQWADFTPPFLRLKKAGFSELVCGSDGACKETWQGLCIGSHAKTFRRGASMFRVDRMYGNDEALRRLSSIAVDESDVPLTLSDHRPIIARFNVQ